MYRTIRQKIKLVYFNDSSLSFGDLKNSQKKVIVSGLTANMITSLTSSTFLVGYLNYLGASAEYAAIIGSIPLLGCILQMFSPYIFERLKHRKLLICLFCFIFRFSLGTLIFVPYIFKERSWRLTVIMIIYTIGFFIAGFVTPGLSNWNMSIAPQKARGKFFAIKDITAMLGAAGSSLIIGRVLDYYEVNNKAMIGFSIMFGIVLIISILDFILISSIGEPEVPMNKNGFTLKQTIEEPIKDPYFRKIIIFLSLWNFAINFSVTFIPVYMVTSLNLSYSFISAVNVFANVFGMISIFLWGSLADRTSWNFLLRISGTIIAFCYLGWSLVMKKNAFVLVPIFQILLTGSNAAFVMSSSNMQFLRSPVIGKTMYLGVTQSISSVVGFCGGLLGAFTSHLIKGLHIQWNSITIGSMQILFLITGLILLTVLLKINLESQN